MNKNFSKKIKLSILAQEIFYALFIFVFGFLVVWRSFGIFDKEEIASEVISAGEIIFYFFIATLVILLFVSFIKSRKFFQIFFILIIFSGLQVIFAALLNPQWSVLTAVILVVLRYIYPSVWMHNLIMILALSGVGAVFGLSVSPLTAILVLAVLAFYDVVAVFMTKHMVKLARGLADKGVFLALIIPEKLKFLPKKIDDVKMGGGFVILGGGDLALPLVLASSTAVWGFGHYFLISAFALGGFAATHWIFSRQKKRRPIPALPPIAAFSILGFIISLLIF